LKSVPPEQEHHLGANRNDVGGENADVSSSAYTHQGEGCGIDFNPVHKKMRMIMKKMLTLCVLIAFATPAMALADGRSDFKAKCASCHGANANLLPKTARLLKVNPKKLALKASEMTRDQMIAITEKGKDKMPSFEKELTKEQITAIVDYVRSLNKK
jgi:mono/diheme cytochrome c family protein